MKLGDGCFTSKWKFRSCSLATQETCSNGMNFQKLAQTRGAHQTQQDSASFDGFGGQRWVKCFKTRLGLVECWVFHTRIQHTHSSDLDFKESPIFNEGKGDLEQGCQNRDPAQDRGRQVRLQDWIVDCKILNYLRKTKKQKNKKNTLVC